MYVGSCRESLPVVSIQYSAARVRRSADRMENGSLRVLPHVTIAAECRRPETRRPYSPFGFAPTVPPPRQVSSLQNRWTRFLVHCSALPHWPARAQAPQKTSVEATSFRGKLRKPALHARAGVVLNETIMLQRRHDTINTKVTSLERAASLPRGNLEALLRNLRSAFPLMHPLPHGVHSSCAL